MKFSDIEMLPFTISCIHMKNKWKFCVLMDDAV